MAPTAPGARNTRASQNRRKSDTPKLKKTQEATARNPSIHHHPAFGSVESVPLTFRRPAKFWEGVDLTYRVVETTRVLREQGKLDFPERVALLADAKETLACAQKRQSSDNEKDINDLQSLILVRQKEISQPNLSRLRDSLYVLEPRYPLTRTSVLRWYAYTGEILRSLRLAIDPKQWDGLFLDLEPHIVQQFQRLCGLMVGSADATDATLVSRRFLSRKPRPPTPLSDRLVKFDGQLDSAMINVAAIAQQYCDWSDDRLDQANMSALFNDLKEIRIILGQLLTERCNGELQLDMLISRTHRVIYEGWRAKFETVWANAVQQSLTDRIKCLAEKVANNDTCNLALDVEFTNLAEDFEIVSGRSDLDYHIDAETWSRFLPSLIDDSKVRAGQNLLQNLYQQFQTSSYLVAGERSSLWFLIWRSLKTTYLLIQQNENLPTSDYSLEANYFQKPEVQRVFEFLKNKPEFLYPASPEYLVGMYCIMVAKKHSGRDLSSRRIQQFSNRSLSSSTLTWLMNFPRQTNWEPRALLATQKAAVRLNFLNGGPGFVRRSGVDHQGMVVSWVVELQAIKDIEPKSLKDDVAAVQASKYRQTTKMYHEMHHKPRDGSFSLPLEWSHPFAGHRNEVDDMENMSWPEPDRRTLPSTFDYVAYPFAETRAHEVAQSRQISRDLRNPFIVSEGALVSDVINLPPLHVRAPETHSVLRKRLPFGPVEMIKGLFAALFGRQKSDGAGRIITAIGRPIITARYSRAASRNVLKARKDSRTRIEKSTVKMPKLRGGGAARYNITADDVDISHGYSTNQIADSIAAVRTRMLRAGLNHYLPNNDQIRHYLQLSDYDEGAAAFEIGFHHQNELPDGVYIPSQAPPTRQPLFNLPTGHLPVQPVHVTGSSTPPTQLLPSAQIPFDIYVSPDGRSRNISPLHSCRTNTSQYDDNEENVVPTVEVPHTRTCHPCPIYQGQYHHCCPSGPSCSSQDQFDRPLIPNISQTNPSRGFGASPSRLRHRSSTRSTLVVPDSQSSTQSPTQSPTPRARRLQTPVSTSHQIQSADRSCPPGHLHTTTILIDDDSGDEIQVSTRRQPSHHA